MFETSLELMHGLCFHLFKDAPGKGVAVFPAGFFCTIIPSQILARPMDDQKQLEHPSERSSAQSLGLQM